MKVSVKKLNISSMEIKGEGIELSVYNKKGKESKHLGDLVIQSGKVIWCRGRTTPERGHAITWEKFIKMMQGS